MRHFIRSHRFLFTLGFAALLLLGFRGADKYFEISRNMDIFGKVFTEVNTVYVDETNPTEMMQTGIFAMLEGLDPYTNFFPESMIEQSMVLNSGQLSGIGAELGQRGADILILELFQDGVADKAGLRVGDRILRIDDEAIGKDGRSLDEAQNLIQGEPGSQVKLEVLRPGQGNPMKLTLTRGGSAAQPENVPFSGMINDSIGYILLNNFMGSAGNEVASALKQLKESHPDLAGVILDLRGNPGGRLDEAVNVCNVFVPQGTLISEMKGRTPASNQRFSTLRPALDTDIPLVVLIDENSASASEIVSGAIQDLDRGVVLGRRSYGKGLVQNVRPLVYNTQMKVTIARYYIPSGRCIQSIDYAHRNPDGSPGKVPDSAIHTFETRAGRLVYDGGGIAPDVEVAQSEAPTALLALLEEGVIFDFVTDFMLKNDSITSPREFRVEESTYAEFVAFVKARGFQFSTRSEADLSAFAQALPQDGLESTLSEEVTQLRRELEQLKQRDLERHREAISEALRQAIVSRYYFKQGLLESGFSFDADIREAVQVMHDQSRYRRLLSR